MPSVNITTTTVSQEFPAGTQLGQMRFRLSQGGLPVSTMYSELPLPPVVTFPNVAPGTYSLHIQRFTTASIPIGPAYVTEVIVAAPPPVSGEVPSGATVTVS